MDACVAMQQPEHALCCPACILTSSMLWGARRPPEEMLRRGAESAKFHIGQAIGRQQNAVENSKGSCEATEGIIPSKAYLPRSASFRISHVGKRKQLQGWNYLARSPRKGGLVVRNSG